MFVSFMSDIFLGEEGLRGERGESVEGVILILGTGRRLFQDRLMLQRYFWILELLSVSVTR